MKSYHEEWEPAYSPDLVIEEASRCLLCLDAPCSSSCPAGTDPAKFIRSVRFRNFKGAAETIRINNVLGAVCARVCPTEKYCQLACSRTQIDRPIDIGRIQKYVTDFEDRIQMKVYHKEAPTGKRVAIIGAGPSGLQAAASLALKGHEVTIYESQEKAGGWLRYGIPEYRLPNEIVDKEIHRIEELGVKIVTNTQIDDNQLAKLLKEYDAVLLSTGSPTGRILPIFEKAKNVETAVHFLARVKEAKGNVEVPNKVLIIGGGDVAMDAATTLKALGAEDVVAVARETVARFPASKEEYQTSHEARVSIIDGFTPVDVKDNTVTFEHVSMNGKLEITADLILIACGQISSLESMKSIPQTRGEAETDGSLVKGFHNLFVAGDIVKGDKSVVYAVRTGKVAANDIDNYLKGGKKND